MPRLLCLILALALALAPRAARADYDAGERAYNNQQWIEAIANLRPISETDDRAAFILGKMYLDGDGVLSNPVEAMRLFRISAAKANTLAMLSIAAIYQQGMGYKKDVRLANEWFRRAAMAGNQYAALFYGVSLFEGDQSGRTDFKSNPAEAYKWFRIAATTGNFPKVKDAAEASANAAAHRLQSVDRVRIDKEVAAWKPVSPYDMGPLPPPTKE